ncbi:hypothetical protein ABL78_3195 [Leptomonas seymouri]|uniref:Uncharacterized protein n=1 Tax=Leptomonas seymouri TaxID=5684 RepID=A0A0N1PCA0_LEPSE|nr:hypothetical protein ABL78_3195 [Leptomonas seymouri]|eukprot:KPI87722.1 hypothetical protein ABL78_3195 [Leptomonas seymouri]
MMDAERKADKTSASTSKVEPAVKGSKPSAAVPTGGGSAPAYAGADGMHVTQPIPVPASVMPYYGQYAAMYTMPPGATPIGFSMQQPQNGSTPPMWMPGMVSTPPQSGTPSQSMPAQPYMAPYGAGTQPLMYMPMSYSYPPYMPAQSPAAMGASFPGQQAKPPGQGATPPYSAPAGAAAAAAAPAHQHSTPAEPAIISPSSIPSSASPNTTVATNAAAATPAVPAVTPVEYVVMPLMPNTNLPPGDPFCPAGVTVSSQYAVSTLPTRTSAVPDRALTNGIHRPTSSALPTTKSEPTPPSATVTSSAGVPAAA